MSRSSLVIVKTNRMRIHGLSQNRLFRIKVTRQNKSDTFFYVTNKDKRIFIPKKLRSDLKINSYDTVKATYSLVPILKRKSNLFMNNKFNIPAFVPEKTLSNYPIFLTESNRKVFACCSTRGGIRSIILDKTIPLSFSKCLGYYQAEGSKNKLVKGEGREFSFTNTSLPILKDFIELFHLLANKDLLKASIYFNPKLSLSTIQDLKKEFVSYGLIQENIKFYPADRLKKYSVNLFISNSMFSDIFNHALKVFRNYLISTEDHSYLALLFLKGVIAGDGTLSKNRDKHGSLHSKINIYEQHKEVVNDYKQILDNFNFKGKIKKDKHKDLYTLTININWRRLLLLLDFDLLENKSHKEKLIWLITNHKRYKSLKHFTSLPSNFNIQALKQQIPARKVILYNWLQKRVREGLISKELVNSWNLTKDGIQLKETLNKLLCYSKTL